MQPPSAPASASERSRDRRSASAFGREAPVRRKARRDPPHRTCQDVAMCYVWASAQDG